MTTLRCLPALLLVMVTAEGSAQIDVIVATDGSGRFTSIQAAIDSIPPDAGRHRTILIRRGTCREKLFIRKGNVALVGEDRQATRIIYPVLRDEWNRDHEGSDWGAGVVNIDTGVTDVTLANLTVYNNHGLQHGTLNKHQFAIRAAGTRIMLLSCTVISDGGDAVSLWNKQNGMYYHADCAFEGWVDFVCPRGWCYITRSTFFGHNTPSASIWHDGSADSTQKFVITDSFFDGVSGFPLGRNHLDAQIYLVRCRFSANMADRPFFRPPSSPAPWRWGDRHYFYDCHRDGGDFAWFADNLETAAGKPLPEEITARWTFDGRWDPESAIPASVQGLLPPPSDRQPPAGGSAR
jgi:pectinesterase